MGSRVQSLVRELRFLMPQGTIKKVNLQTNKTHQPQNQGFKNTMWCVCRRAKSLQSCLAHYDPTACSPPGSHGVLQARIPEWVAMPFSRGFFRPRDWNGVSHVSCVGSATREAHQVVLFPATCMQKAVHGSTVCNCKIWKPQTCPHIGAWLKELCNVRTREHFTAIRKEEDEL